jgi:toxin ParE1/3/4
VTPRFLLSPEAESDLDDIKPWVLANGGPRVALSVMRALLKAIRLLAQRPESGHKREDLTNLPLRFWPVFSYLIVYGISVNSEVAFTGGNEPTLVAQSSWICR